MGFLPGKSLGTGASVSRDVSFSSLGKRSLGVGMSSTGAIDGLPLRTGGSDVTELGAVDPLMGNDSETGASVSVGEEVVDILSVLKSLMRQGDKDGFLLMCCCCLLR